MCMGVRATISNLHKCGVNVCPNGMCYFVDVTKWSGEHLFFGIQNISDFPVYVMLSTGDAKYIKLNPNEIKYRYIGKWFSAGIQFCVKFDKKPYKIKLLAGASDSGSVKWTDSKILYVIPPNCKIITNMKLGNGKIVFYSGYNGKAKLIVDGKVRYIYVKYGYNSISIPDGRLICIKPL